MSLELGALLVGLGLLASFFSGLLGIGGALIVVPLLLYVPQSLGLAAFDIKEASAVAVAQVAVAAASGTVANLRRRIVYWRLTGVLVTAMVLGGLFGGWISRWIPAPRLVLLSAGMATVAASTMLLPLGHGETGLTQPPFQVSLALALGLVVGALIGLVGTGAFLLIPVQVYLLRMPTRTAIATSLSAGFPTALAALAGKALAGQVPWFATLVVCLPALPGAQLGSALAAHLPARVLRMVYAVVIAMVAAVLWYDVLHTP